MTTSERDVIEVLTHDHREVERMFAELEALHGIGTDEARQRRKDLTDQLAKKDIKEDETKRIRRELDRLDQDDRRLQRLVEQAYQIPL